MQNTKSSFLHYYNGWWFRTLGFNQPIDSILPGLSNIKQKNKNR
jgi:hypothetical protein